jgi:chromosome condensin MukBEF complex kleisin-like MukF subunit
MNGSKQADWLRELQDTVAREKGLSPDTLRRLLAKVEEYSESHHSLGLQDELLSILQEDLNRLPAQERSKEA